jgi:ATP-dependent exoDNAse (exonuclease V) alpha subunit
MDKDNGYSLSTLISNIVPFTAVCDDTRKYNTYYNRWYMPLEVAFAITTHKMQGATCTGNCVTQASIGAPFSRGLDYVATSRVTELKKLFLINPLTKTQFTSDRTDRRAIKKEYDRLNKSFNSSM